MEGRPTSTSQEYGIASENRQLPEWDPSAYLKSFLAPWRLSEPNSLEHRLVRLLTANSDLSDHHTLDLARLAQSQFPLLDLWLARALRDSGTEQMQRILWVLSEIPTSNRVLPLLAPALRTTEERVRSKAALLLTRLSHNPSLANQLRRTAGSRVRANAVEGLWGLKHRGVIETLRSMTRDTDNRTMANAALGLFFSGDETGIEVLRQMAQSLEPLYRASAAWAMGETGERSLLPLLDELSEDATTLVRRTASRAVVKMSELEGGDSST